MAKKTPVAAAEVDDLLGSTTKPAAKKAAVKTATPAPAAKTAAKGKAKPAADAGVDDALEGKTPAAKKVAAKAAAPAKEKRVKVPVHFAEGERQALYDAVTAHFKRSKKAIASKDLAEKLEVPTRKLRPVLYSMAKRAEPIISIHLESSRAAGMTVSPA